MSSAICLLLVSGLLAWAQTPYPVPQGWVSDYAQVLDAATKEKLNALLADVEKRTTVEMAVVVVQTTAPLTPKQYVTELFNRWGTGKRGADNGVMILLAVQDRRVEIETGYGVEGILPDGKVGEIIRTTMLPHFKNNRWGAGLLAGTERIAQTLLEAYPAARPAAPPVPVASPVRTVFSVVGWGYFLFWIGVLLVQNVRRQTLSYGTLALLTLPAIVLVFLAFFPFIIPLLIGLFVLIRNVRARCPKCGHWLTTSARTLRAPSAVHAGRRELVYDCPVCGYHDVHIATLAPTGPRRVRPSRWPIGGIPMGGGPGGWPGGWPGGAAEGNQREHRSFRNFGGGSSGGGGAGSSF